MQTIPCQCPEAEKHVIQGKCLNQTDREDGLCDLCADLGAPTPPRAQVLRARLDAVTAEYIGVPSTPQVVAQMRAALLGALAGAGEPVSGVTIDGGPEVNTPETLARGEIRVNVSVPREMAERLGWL